MIYNDPAATPASEASHSASPSAGLLDGPLAGSLTGSASGLAASIYIPSPVPPSSASVASTVPASAFAAHRKFTHPRVFNLKIHKITTLTRKENY